MADPAVKSIADELDRNFAATGNYERAVFGAGQVSALIKNIKPIRAIIEDMVS
jgi:NAD(P)H-dependent flavin oxidoreductase YrpB (nitropropane dioxygenase family)